MKARKLPNQSYLKKIQEVGIKGEVETATEREVEAATEVKHEPQDESKTGKMKESLEVEPKTTGVSAVSTECVVAPKLKPKSLSS